LLAPGARGLNLDLNALLAIAGHEGASGRVGDGGHAFGPFQLNDAGGVLTGKLAGLTPEQKNAWAWSPAGIRFALQGIARVASGQRGEQAIRSIASRFERPADVGAEIRDALAHYGGSAPASAPAAPAVRGLASTAPAAAAAPSLGGLLGSIVASTNQTLGLGGSNVLASLLSQPTPAQPVRKVAPMPIESSGPPVARKGGIAELLREGVGGPTHSTGPHIHAAFTDPRLELQAIQWAQQHGLHVGENPYVGSLAPAVHAPNSFHKRVFPGLYHGRKLGEAIDVSGPGMGAFYSFLSRYR
jgi:hypothetical protein